MNNLNPTKLAELTQRWLLEDTTSNCDLTGFTVEADDGEIEIVQETPGILAGRPFIDAVISQLNSSVIWYHDDGDVNQSLTKVASVFVPAKKLFLLESIVLKILSRASGLATIAFNICNFLKSSEWNGVFTGISENTPGFKMVEEYATVVGGASTYELPTMIFLKQIHVYTNGSIRNAVEKVRRVSGSSFKIKVQCRTLKEAVKAGKAGCDIILLDNIERKELMQNVHNLKCMFPAALIEVCGAITDRNIQEYIHPSIDILSSNCLVHCYPRIDFSMNVKSQTITLDEEDD